MAPDHSKSRRARLQLSCQPCRVGKLKCNRELPCEQCVKRSRETQCVYTTGAQESINYKAQARAMREKLENLERAVQQFKSVDQGRASETPADVESDIAAISLDKDLSGAEPLAAASKPSTPYTRTGSIMTTHNGEAFIGPAHWASIMNDIEDVKAYLDDDDDELVTVEASVTPSEQNGSAGSPEAFSPPSLYLRASAVSKEQLIASVPQKAVADRLLAAYFGSMDMYKPSIHVPTFQRQYQQLWQNPHLVSSTWLALLFSILALGFQYTLQTLAKREKNIYLEVAGNAILTADYTKPKPYTIEGILLWIRCCQMQGPERQFKDWLNLGLLCRLALRMGYHRDPSHYPEMSPFDGEMRRRIWMFVSFMDVTQSYQVGLLSVISGLDSNVALPRNVYDSDFGPESTELPPSRPDSEFTTLGHSLHKGRLLPLFGQAVKLSHAPVPPNLKELYAVSSALQRVQNEIPPPLEIRPADQSLGDSPNVLIKRFGMELLAQKTRCVLFRRYLGSSETKARKECVSAALRCLKVQRMLEEARLPGGPLCNSPAQHFWDLMDSFLLATIIIGLELKAVQRERASQSAFVYSDEEYRIMLAAIRTSCRMWEECGVASDKAKRAARAVAKVLQLGSSEQTTHSLPSDPMMASPLGGLLDQPTSQQVDTKMWPSPADSAGLSEFDFNSFEMSDAQQTFPDTSGDSQPQVSMAIDWGAWDSQINSMETSETFMIDSDILGGGLGVNPFSNHANGTG